MNEAEREVSTLDWQRHRIAELEAEVERLRELFQKLLHEYAGTIEGEWGLDEGPTGSMYQEVERRWSSRLNPEPKK